MFSQSHPAAKGLINKVFPYYNDVLYVFGKWSGYGSTIKDLLIDVGSNVPESFNGFPIDDAHDLKIPTMYNQGLDMSSDELMST